MTFKEFLKRIADKWFCLHDWDRIEEIRVFSSGDSKMPSGYIRHFICKNCGEHKKINL